MRAPLSLQVVGAGHHPLNSEETPLGAVFIGELLAPVRLRRALRILFYRSFVSLSSDVAGSWCLKFMDGTGRV